MPPTVVLNGAPTVATVGQSLTLGATITDPSPVDTTAGFTKSWTVKRHSDGVTIASGSNTSVAFTPGVKEASFGAVVAGVPIGTL